MLSYLNSKLLRVVPSRPLASVAVNGGRYSVSYSVAAASISLGLRSQPSMQRVNEVRPSDGLAWIQGARETQSLLTVLAQVLRFYLGHLILDDCSGVLASRWFIACRGLAASLHTWNPIGLAVPSEIA